MTGASQRLQECEQLRLRRRSAVAAIYVITATSIARTTGEQPEVIAQGDW
jgi:hypothetical protein